MECGVASRFLTPEAGKSRGNGWAESFIVDICIGDVSTHALVDSGCEQTLIEDAVLVSVSWETQGTMAISCIHGETRLYPTTKIYLTVGSQTSHVIVAVARELPYPVILG